MDFLEALSEYGQEICILTARDITKVWEWLEKYRMNHLIYMVTNEKLPAIVYIDDRGLKHNGDFDETLKKLEDFKVHWKEECPFKSWQSEEKKYGTLKERGILK